MLSWRAISDLAGAVQLANPIGMKGSCHWSVQTLTALQGMSQARTQGSRRTSRLNSAKTSVHVGRRVGLRSTTFSVNRMRQRL
jgi:hypothetical protein